MNEKHLCPALRFAWRVALPAILVFLAGRLCKVPQSLPTRVRPGHERIRTSNGCPPVQTHTSTQAKLPVPQKASMEALGGVDIGSMLRSTGPIVKCVLLRAAGADGGGHEQKKPAAATSDEVTTTNDTSSSPDHDDDDDDDGKKAKAASAAAEGRASSEHPLVDLIEEIEVDTTPKKAMVQQVLGGPFTFLGQYEDEGIMVMVRRPDFAVDDGDDDGDDDSDAEQENVPPPPLNPHRLQPPLHKKEVHGDILLMRVAPAKEEEEEGEDANEDEEEEAAGENEDEGKGDAGANEEGEEEEQEAAAAAAEAAAASAVSNDDFFLDYTRAEYLKFAARTDIPEHEIDDGEEDEEEEEEVGEGSDDDDEEEGGSDEEFGLEDMDDDDEDDDDAQVGMMNLIFGQILRRFREENGRGPDTRELLEMRSALAERLGVDVPPVDDEGSDWDKKAPPKSPGPKLGGTPRKQPQPNDDEDNEEEEKKADGEADKDASAANNDDAEQNDDTSEKRGEKRTGDEAGVTAGTPATDEDSDGDNSEERARKRVKFVPKEDHTVHVVERIDHNHSADGDESSDEDYVEDGAAGADAEEEQDGDARVELEL